MLYIKSNKIKEFGIIVNKSNDKHPHKSMSLSRALMWVLQGFKKATKNINSWNNILLLAFQHCSSQHWSLFIVNNIQTHLLFETDYLSSVSAYYYWRQWLEVGMFTATSPRNAIFSHLILSLSNFLSASFCNCYIMIKLRVASDQKHFLLAKTMRYWVCRYFCVMGVIDIKLYFFSQYWHKFW